MMGGSGVTTVPSVVGGTGVTIEPSVVGTGGSPQALGLQFMTGALDPRISFTRATTGTVTDFEGLIKNVKSGEVRFDGMRRVENLLTYSQDFSNAAWAKGNTTITGNVINAPDETLTADKLIEDTVNSTHQVYETYAAPVANSAVLFSVYAKAAERSVITLVNAGLIAPANFDLSTGVATGAGTAMYLVGNGWYRCCVLSIAPDTTGRAYAIRLNNGSGTSYAGTTGYGAYIWGAQLENVTGQANQNPSEYVSTNVLSAPYQGANVDGVQYFPYTNPNCIINGAITQIPTIAINSNNSKFAYNCVASGDYFSTPSSTANQITGDISLLVQVALDDWTPATVQTLVAKDGVSAGTRSWALNIQTSGAPRLNYSLDGTTIISVTASASTGFTDGTTHFVGVQREAATGIVRFYTSEDGTAFTQLGTDQTGTAGSLYNATSTQVQFGSLASSGFDLFGKIYDSHVYTGLKFTGSSTMVMDFDPSNWTSGSTFTGLETGEVWTLNGNAKIYQGLWDAVGPKSWLIEEARTNLTTYSQAIRTNWGLNGTGTESSGISPDGTNNAYIITASTVNAGRYSNSAALAINTTYTVSCYCRLLSASGSVQFGCSGSMFGAGTTLTGIFNLSTLTFSSLTAAVTSSGYQNVGSGWYRIWLTGTSTATATNSPTICYNNTVGATIGFWGAQLEAGSSATSYIPTITAQVTRNGDQGSMTGTNFSSWYNASAGTMYAEFDFNFIVNNLGVYSINLSSSPNNNRLDHRSNAATNTAAGVALNSAAISFSTTNVMQKLSSAYTVTDSAASKNGATVASYSLATMPTVDRLLIGQLDFGGNQLNGHIRTIRYYSQRLPNTTLQSLTA
jgi:hypothetical protein